MRGLLTKLVGTPTLVGLLLPCLMFVAALLRMWNVGEAPVFIDEDIYTQTSLEMTELPLLEAFSRPPRAAYGKPPLPFVLQSWLTSFTQDPVLAGRMLSAIAGTITSMMCFFLGSLLGGSRVGLVAAALYAVSPFAVLHERMVLQDGPMAMFALLTALSSWQAVQRQSVAWALLAAASGAIAVQLKTPAIGVVLLPYLALITCRSNVRPRIVLASSIAAAPAVVYLALMLGPLGAALALQNRGLIDPLRFTGENAANWIEALRTYFPGPLFWLTVAGMVVAARSAPRRGIAFLIVVASWTVPWLLLSRFAPARYYLPSVPYLCALAALAIVRIPGLVRWRAAPTSGLVAIVALVAFGFPAMESWRIASAHADAAMTSLDDFQYRRGWPSGYPYQRLRDFLGVTREADATVVYSIDPEHWVAAGGERSVALSDQTIRAHPRDPFPFDRMTAIYFVVDDDRNTSSPRRVARAIEREPRLEWLADFNRLDSTLGISVLRLPPLADRGEPRRCGYRISADAYDEPTRRGPRAIRGQEAILVGLFSEIAGDLLLTADLHAIAGSPTITLVMQDRVVATVTAPDRRTTPVRLTTPIEAGANPITVARSAPHEALGSSPPDGLVISNLSLQMLNPSVRCRLLNP